VREGQEVTYWSGQVLEGDFSIVTVLEFRMMKAEATGFEEEEEEEEDEEVSSLLIIVRLDQLLRSRIRVVTDVGTQ